MNDVESIWEIKLEKSFLESLLDNSGYENYFSLSFQGALFQWKTSVVFNSSGRKYTEF